MNIVTWMNMVNMVAFFKSFQVASPSLQSLRLEAANQSWTLEPLSESHGTRLLEILPDWGLSLCDVLGIWAAYIAYTYQSPRDAELISDILCKIEPASLYSMLWLLFVSKQLKFGVDVLSSNFGVIGILKRKQLEPQPIAIHHTSSHHLTKKAGSPKQFCYWTCSWLGSECRKPIWNISKHLKTLGPMYMFLKPGPSLSSIWMPGPGIYVLPIESRSTVWIIFWTLPVEQRQTQMDMENPVTVLYFLILDCFEHVVHCIIIIFSIEIRWNKLGHCRWWKSPILRHTPIFSGIFRIARDCWGYAVTCSSPPSFLALNKTALFAPIVEPLEPEPPAGNDKLQFNMLRKRLRNLETLDVWCFNRNPSAFFWARKVTFFLTGPERHFHTTRAYLRSALSVWIQP